MLKKLQHNKVIDYFDFKKRTKLLQSTFLIMSLFCFTDSLFSQTTLINPATDGGFNSGNTFAANGWTVANEGTGMIKWAVGTAVNSGAITGNSAYVTVDDGLNNSYVGIGAARTVFFYRDVVLPPGQTNIALAFNWKSGVNTWQVYVAPTSVTPVGNDAQPSFSGFPSVAPLTGATPVVLGVANGTTTQKATGFIPASFAGSTVRLIFMWSNNTGATNPPLAIDNISLVSRVGGQLLSSNASGNYSDASTWDLNYVPSPTDEIVINANHTVTIDNRYLGVENAYIAGANAILQFGLDTDEFTINNDLLVSGSGARFNVYNGVNGRSLKVGHNIDLTSGGRLDISVGSSSVGLGQLDLSGSSVQTIFSDGTGILGGSVVSTINTNTSGMINQLNITNTSTAASNIIWNINNVRIKNALRLNRARVALGTNKIILGNFAVLSTVVAPFGNGFKGGIVSRWYTTSATGTAVNPGTDHNPNTNGFYPIISANGQNRSAYIISSAATTAGELEISYTDASTFGTGLSIADGSYTVTNRYNGNWAVTNAGSGGTIYANAGMLTFGAYASGAFETNDGSSRIMYNGAATAGEHINGTTTPFVSRKGLTLANLMASPLHVGFNTASVLGTTTITSVTSGDWNTPATWSTNAVPVCADVVKIASGHTVTNNGTANASGITVDFGGTLVNASNNLTVGCTNNNAVFANYGTLTVSGGTVTVNGGLSHKNGSTFNQTGGDIVIDSNAGGVAANSVGVGGSSLKIETSSLNLTNGTITIVDPLVNNVVATTANSGAAFNLDTMGATGNFTRGTTGTAFTGVSTVVMAGLNANKAIYDIGQIVSGTGIAPGTTITSVSAGQLSNSPITLGLSLPITADITSGASLTFSSMSNGCATIDLVTTGNAPSIAVGQIVTGTGIPGGTTILSIGYDNAGTAILGVKLSNAVTGLATSPIALVQTLSFSAVSENCSTIILSAANPLIVVGQPVSGIGIQSGTTVAAYTGTTRLDLSLPTTPAIISPVTLSFYDGNLGSCAVSYNSPNHYAAGINHTLQIGDGVSIEKGAVTTNGYLCNFAQGGGLLSLGKLTVNALDGSNRFFNTVNNLNVQDTFTITNGSVFKKTVSTGGLYFGGNIINNGSTFVHNSSQVKLLNVINGVEVASSTAQTISGTGTFYNNLSVTTANASFPNLTVNNASTGGVTIATPNFRVQGTLTMNGGIIHTSTATPLYHGLTDLVSTGFIAGTFSDTCFIDGPYTKAIATNGTNSSFVLYPVGKTSYKPLSLAVTGGGDFTVEAFDSNTGNPSVNVANISATRWKATRNGSLGALTDFNVRLGNAGLLSNNIVVQATLDQGNYDVLGASIFAAGTPTSIPTVNNITTVTAIAGGSFTGNFAYATAPNCTVVNPGNTIANLATSIVVHTQRSTATGIVNGNATVTLGATANTLIVPGLLVSGTGIQTGTTVVSAAGTSLVLSLPASVSSTSAVTLTFTSVQNPSTLNGAQEVVLSLQNNGDGNGVTYQWQSSPDGVTYSNIGGAIAATSIANPVATTYYQCIVTCPNGPVTVISTPVVVTFSNTAPAVTNNSGCVGSAIALGATSSTGTVSWYALVTGGKPMVTGTTYSPSPASTTTYYVSGENTYTAGRSFSGTATQTSDYSGLIFNTTAKIRLNSVKIHPKQTVGNLPQPITIKLYDKNGVQVAGTSAVTITPSVNTGGVSASISDLVTLNYDIPVGTGYKLLVTSGLTSANALGKFETFGDSQIPVGGGSIGITAGASSFTGTSTSAYINFFDLNVTNVIDTPRVPVTATVINTPAPTTAATQDACGAGTIADFTVTGEVGATFTWYDAATLGTILPTSTAVVNNTTYYVSQTANGCEGPRVAILASGACLGTNDFTISELKYYPNPVSDQLTITAKETITRVELYNLLGQQLRVLKVNADNVQVDFNGLAPSTYLIKLYSEENVEYFKIIKK
ncbi:MAG: T9SS type A sorting domain-containing protein [Bacteroidota bacterium]